MIIDFKLFFAKIVSISNNQCEIICFNYDKIVLKFKSNYWSRTKW